MSRAGRWSAVPDCGVLGNVGRTSAVLSLRPNTLTSETHPFQGLQKTDCGPETVFRELRRAARRGPPRAGLAFLGKTMIPGGSPRDAHRLRETKSNTPRPGSFGDKEVGDSIKRAGPGHASGELCPPPPKLRAQQALLLAAGVCPFSLLPWSCLQEPSLAGAGDPEEVSAAVLPLGEALLTWTGPLLPGPTAQVCPCSGGCKVGGGVGGNRNVPATLSPLPSPLERLRGPEPMRLSGCSREGLAASRAC